MSPQTKGWKRSVWSLASWIALSGLVTAVVAALMFLQRADAQLRDYLEKKLASAYPHLVVHVGSAQLRQGEGIVLRQVSLARPAKNTNEARSELAYLESLTIHSNTNLAGLLQGRLKLRQITANGLVLRANREHDGRWNVQDLVPGKLPLPSGLSIPPVILENATLEIRDTTRSDEHAMRIEGLRLRVRCQRLAAAGGADPEIGAAPASDAAHEATGSRPLRVPPMLVAIDGWFHNEWCRRVNLEGIARTSDGAWNLRGDLDALGWSADLLKKLPEPLASPLARLGALRALLDGRFEVRQTGRSEPVEFAWKGRLSGGQWVDPQLPQAITDLQMDIAASNNSWSVTNAHARFGEAWLTGSLEGSGRPDLGSWRGQMKFDQLVVTQRLVEHLPAIVQEHWAKVKLEGRFSGQVSASFDGQQPPGKQFDSTAEVRGEDASLTFFKFPYTVSQIVGSIQWADRRLTFEGLGSAGSTPVEVRGSLLNPGKKFTGWWEVKTRSWKTIDEPLIAALPAGAANVVRDMQPRGNVGCWIRQERNDPEAKAFPHMILAIDDGWVNYTRFPYPISKVQGRIEWREGRWAFEQLEGWNDGCHVRCEGRWLPEEPDKPLQLDFDLHDLVLDPELRQALNPQAQAIWGQLRPQGQLDEVQVTVRDTLKTLTPDISVRIKQEPGRSAAQQERLQLYPVFFPLNLTEVSGEMQMVDSNFSLRDLVAHHGSTTLRANGSGEFRPQGAWVVQLTDVAADRLEARKELLQALPPRLSGALQRLQLDGTFGLAGAMHFRREGHNQPLVSGWNLSLSVEQGQMFLGFPVQAIFGQVDLKGASRDDSYWTRGRLQLDSMMARGIQVTRLAGPLWIDTQGAVLGERVQPATADQPSRPVTAEVYGGTLQANFETNLREEADFALQANLTNADLAAVARDWRLGQGNLSGQAFLEIALEGNTRGRNTWRGGGTCQVRNANLLELPLFLAIFNRLSSGRRDNTAFTQSDVAFRVRDDYVYFDRFDLSGDTITLKGRGEMSLDQELALNFYSVVNEQLWSPLVRPFLGEASRQFLLIRVDGTLGQPQTSQEVLPGLNETLQQMFPEQVDPATATKPPGSRGAALPRRPFSLR
jgi:hypothetical protein